MIDPNKIIELDSDRDKNKGIDDGWGDKYAPLKTFLLILFSLELAFSMFINNGFK